MAVAKMSVPELEEFLRKEFPQAFGEGSGIAIESADGVTSVLREHYRESMLRPGGTLLLMWIGELITEKGIGNGISLIIFCGIIAQLPSSAGQFAGLVSGDTATATTAK